MLLQSSMNTASGSSSHQKIGSHPTASGPDSGASRRRCTVVNSHEDSFQLRNMQLLAASGPESENQRLQQHQQLQNCWDLASHPYNFSTLFPTNSTSSSNTNVPLDVTSYLASSEKYLPSEKYLFSRRKNHNPLFLLHSEAEHAGSTSSSSAVASTSTAMTSLLHSSLDEFEQDSSSFDLAASSSQALPMMVLDNCVWTVGESSSDSSGRINSTGLLSLVGETSFSTHTTSSLIGSHVIGNVIHSLLPPPTSISSYLENSPLSSNDFVVGKEYPLTSIPSQDNHLHNHASHLSLDQSTPPVVVTDPYETSTTILPCPSFCSSFSNHHHMFPTTSNSSLMIPNHPHHLLMSQADQFVHSSQHPLNLTMPETKEAMLRQTNEMSNDINSEDMPLNSSSRLTTFV